MREVLDDVRRMLQFGDKVAVATVVDTTPLGPPPARLAARAELEWRDGRIGLGRLRRVGRRPARRGGAGRRAAALLRYGISDDDAFDVGLPCGGEIEVFVQPVDAEELDRVEAALALGRAPVRDDDARGRGRRAQAVRGRATRRSAAVRTDESTFVEHYAPAPVMMIFGAVDTAQALCRMARQVGFHTIVSDARGKFATRERLPDADEIVVGWPAMAYDLHGPDEATYVVVLTHDARFDEPPSAPPCARPCPTSARSAAAVRRTHAVAGS